MIQVASNTVIKNNKIITAGLFEMDLGLDDVSPSTEPVELDDSTNVTTDADSSQSPPTIDDEIDESMFDDHEEQLVEKRRCEQFIMKTCGCTKVDGKPCSDLFSAQHYTDLRAQATLLTHEQLDLVIMGSIMSTTNASDDVIHGRHKPAKRQKTCIAYMHSGQHCAEKHTTFCIVWGNIGFQPLRRVTSIMAYVPGLMETAKLPHTMHFLLSTSPTW